MAGTEGYSVAPREDIDERNRGFLATAQQRGIREAAILMEDEACSACRTLILAYELRHLPVLPLADCTRPGGCLCSYGPLPPR